MQTIQLFFNAIRCIALLVVLQGCGDDVYVNPAPVVDETIPETLAGTHYLENGNCITISKNQYDVYSILDDCQSLVTENPKNGTFGQLPRITLEGLYKDEDGALRFFRDYNYNSGHDIEEDVSGANITGKKRTDFVIFVESDGKLKMVVSIYDNANNNNLNEVVAYRTFKEL